MALLTNWLRQEQPQPLPAGHSWCFHHHSITLSNILKLIYGFSWVFGRPRPTGWRTSLKSFQNFMLWPPEMPFSVHAVVVVGSALGKLSSSVPGTAEKPLKEQIGKLEIPVPTRTHRTWLVAQVLGFSSFHRHLNPSFSVQLIKTHWSFVIAL